jgi:hypothetical protein
MRKIRVEIEIELEKVADHLDGFVDDNDETWTDQDAKIRVVK